MTSRPSSDGRGAGLPAREGSRGSQHAALTRLARRMARTGGWRHVLIVALIALAVAAAVGVAVTVRSTELPEEVALAAEFGAAHLRVSQYTGEIRFEDLPAELQRTVRDLGVPTTSEDEPTDVEEVIRTITPRAELLRADRGYTFLPEVGQLWLRAVDLDHPLAAGLLRVDGPAPGPGQALASPTLLRGVNAAVGDTVELPGQGPVEVVGTVQDARQLHRAVAVLPARADLGAARSETTWLVGLPAPDDRATVEELREAFEPGPREGEERPSDVSIAVRAEHAEMLRRGPREFTETPTFIGSVIGAALLLQVAFVSAAAFATGTRRRLRDLGLLGSVGATPGQVRGVVMREAAVLGTAGALLGLAVGVLGASTIGAYVAERFGGNLVPVLRLHPADLALPTVLGLVAALSAAYLPARTAGRVPVTTALAGRLPVSDVPRWVTPLALASTVVGLLVLYAAVRSGPGGNDEFIIGGGFLITALGAAALAVPLLALLGRLADRLPARLRLAVRDTVRQRTRSAAAVAALTVVLIVPVVVAINAATDAARWAPPPDTRRDVASVAGPHYRGVQLPPTDEMVESAEQVLPAVEERVPVTRLVDRTQPQATSIALVPTEDPAAGEVEAVHTPPGDRTTANVGAAALATPQLLGELGLGHLREQVEDGTVVLLDLGHIHRQRALPDGPAAVIVRGEGPWDIERGAPTATVPLIVAQPEATTWDLPEILMSRDTAERLDLVPVRASVLLDLERPIDAELARGLEQVGRGSTVPFHVAGSSSAFRPSPTGTIGLAVGAALLVALIISGMTAALAATESDHDLELITAVGAAPAIRRVFHGWQAGYHALLAAVLAVPAGLAIYRAVTIRTTSREWMVLPWWWLAAVVIAVPVVVGLTHAGLMRSARLRAPRRIA